MGTRILLLKDGTKFSLKTKNETKNIPVVLLTNLDSISNVEKALGLGATTYLVKADYKLEDVSKKIKEDVEQGDPHSTKR